MNRYNGNASHRLYRYHRWIDTIEMQATDYPDKHRWIDSIEMQATDYADITDGYILWDPSLTLQTLNYWWK